MKNKILIHKSGNLSKLYQKFIISLIPLILYGIYKNGITLYLNVSISFFNIFKPLLLPLCGAGCGLAINYIIKKEIRLNPLVLYGMLIGMMVPISTNILLFIIGLFGLLFLSVFLNNKISFNIVCFVKLLLMILLLIFNNYEYASIVELSGTYAFSLVDIIFGRGIGGICTSSIVWIIVGFCYLLSDYYYKKEIPIYAIISYLLVTLLTYFLVKDIVVVIDNLLASSTLFSFIFIAPLSHFSAYTKNGKFIFGILVGILSAILTIFIGNIEASLVGILLASFLKEIIDRFGQKFTK